MRFMQPCVPSDSLMWPLRPNLVVSSTWLGPGLGLGLGVGVGVGVGLGLG